MNVLSDYRASIDNIDAAFIHMLAYQQQGRPQPEANSESSSTAS
jgi:hypothetical protein